jgi:hypothetical protein
MKSVEKGNVLEDKIFNFLKEELSQGRLGIDSTSGRIYKKKGYYSRDREKDIIVDISIEVWLHGAQNYSYLWVCECKNYEHSVPVDDVEEFKAKLDQIAGKNVKGVMVSSNSYQMGAISFAKNQGIGLVRIMPDKQVKWMLYHMPADKLGESNLDSREFNSALSIEWYQSNNRSFYAIYDGYIFEDWQSLVRHSIVKDS